MFNSKRINKIILIFLLTGLLQPSLFAQTNQKTSDKPIHWNDSSNKIIIHQEINFDVAPAQLYQALLSSKQFSASVKKSFPEFTDTNARISNFVGGTFSVFDGHIIGRILELVPNQRIVEAWRVVDWPAGIYSIAHFEFEPKGSGTHLVFEHVGFPEGLKQHLAEGWEQHYWEPLAKYFQK